MATHRVTWREGKRCPRIRLDTLACDLIIHFEGDEPVKGLVFHIPSHDLADIAMHHPGPPEHWTLTANPKPGSIRTRAWTP